MTIPSRGWVVTMLLLATILRCLAIPLAHSLGLTPDEREYLFLAERLHHDSTFIDSNGDASVRSPLFPVLLSLVPNLSESNLLVPLILECILGVFSVLLIYQLSLDLWASRKAALLAAGVAAVYPGLVLYSVLLLTEMPFVVLFLLLLLRMRRYLDCPAIGEGVLVGILAGLATLTRGVFILPFSLLILLLWISFRDKGWSRLRRAAFSLIPLLVCFIVLAPWTVRNFRVHQAFVPLSTFTGTSLVYGNNPFTHGSTKFDPGFAAWLEEQRKERGVIDSAFTPEYERMKVDEGIAFDYMRTHPWETLLHSVQKAYVLWIYPLSHQQPNKPLKLLMMAADVVLYLGVVLSLGVAKYLHKTFPVIWVSIFGFTFLHLILHAEARYRIPMMPLICVLFGGVALIAPYWRAIVQDKSVLRFTAVLALAVVGVYALTTVLYITGKV